MLCAVSAVVSTIECLKKIGKEKRHVRTTDLLLTHIYGKNDPGITHEICRQRQHFVSLMQALTADFMRDDGRSRP